jgi:uncharacterized protein (DUF58 family)
LDNLKEIVTEKGFKNLDFIANQLVEGFITGLHRSPYHGFSVEFAEHRLYNTGESTKFIDWKLFARTEKLFVKRFEEETNLRCQIIIDTSSSMIFPLENPVNKLKFSIYSAAALINLMKRQRDASGLTLISNDIDFHINPKLSERNISLIYSKLEELLTFDKKNIKTSLSKKLHEVAEMINKRSLVIIFSDMFETDNIQDIFDSLNHLKFKQNEIIVFHLRDKKNELEFNYKNRPYKFIDLETNEELKLSPKEIKDIVKQDFRNFYDDIKLNCGKYKIDFVEADINQSFYQILLQYLIKRNKMQ